MPRWITTATVTIDPQPGYIGTITLSCTISPSIQTSAAATAPTCSLDPTSVDVTADEAASPTTTLTFTAANPGTAKAVTHSNFFYALWLPVPGLALIGMGFGFRSGGDKRNSRPHVARTNVRVILVPGCVTYKHLGNVGTPSGSTHSGSLVVDAPSA